MAPNSFQSPPRLKVVAFRDDSLHAFAPFQAVDFVLLLLFHPMEHSDRRHRTHCLGTERP